MLDVAHLYPLELNLYGDRGNLIALERRAAWRGIQLRVHPVGGGAADLAAYDLVFIGGGQDREQGYVAEDLLSNKAVALRTAVAEGVPLLAVCGGYQLLGRYYRTADGRELPGVGLFDAWTEAGRTRLVGNAAVVSELEGLETLLVGFENHAGRTFLGPASRPLGRVVRGFG
ncbi:MAG: glutamine amidotransferase, partial [Clostridia bacterium]|nr:glutamine amidotransferase [Clostridia bacterium]